MNSIKQKHQNKNIHGDSKGTKLFSHKNWLNEVIFLEYLECVLVILEYNSNPLMIYELFWFERDVMYNQNIDVINKNSQKYWFKHL